MPFLAIYRSLPLLIFFASSWYQKAKIGLWMSLRNKKIINYQIKGLYRTTCYKTKSNFSQLFFSRWLLHKYFFSFLIKAFANFENLIKFNWQAFIVYKRWRKFENAGGSILPKTYSLERYFSLFRPSET